MPTVSRVSWLGIREALVAVHMDRQGVGEIYSFDADFDRLPGVTRLVPGA